MTRWISSYSWRKTSGPRSPLEPRRREAGRHGCSPSITTSRSHRQGLGRVPGRRAPRACRRDRPASTRPRRLGALLALHQRPEPWDGLITTDSAILNQGPELVALIQTNLTLVVALASGHDPVKASPGSAEAHACDRKAGTEGRAQPPSMRRLSSPERPLTKIARTAASAGPRMRSPSTRPRSASSL
jgi:hypothetical protein